MAICFSILYVYTVEYKFMSEKAAKRTVFDLEKIQSVDGKVREMLKDIKNKDASFGSESELEQHVKDRVLKLLRDESLIQKVGGENLFKEKVQEILTENGGASNLQNALDGYWKIYLDLETQTKDEAAEKRSKVVDVVKDYNSGIIRNFNKRNLLQENQKALVNFDTYKYNIIQFAKTEKHNLSEETINSFIYILKTGHEELLEVLGEVTESFQQEVKEVIEKAKKLKTDGGDEFGLSEDVIEELKKAKSIGKDFERDKNYLANISDYEIDAYLNNTIYKDLEKDSEREIFFSRELEKALKKYWDDLEEIKPDDDPVEEPPAPMPIERIIPNNIDQQIELLRRKIEKENKDKPSWFNFFSRVKRKKIEKKVLDYKKEILDLETKKKKGTNDFIRFDFVDHDSRVESFSPKVAKRSFRDTKKRFNPEVVRSVETVRTTANQEYVRLDGLQTGLEKELRQSTVLTQKERDDKFVEIERLAKEKKKTEFLKRKQLLEEARKTEGFAKRTLAVFRENIRNPDTWKRVFLGAVIAGGTVATLGATVGLPALFGAGIAKAMVAGAGVGLFTGATTEAAFGTYLRKRERDYFDKDAKFDKQAVYKILLYGGIGALAGAGGVGVKHIAPSVVQSLLGTTADATTPSLSGKGGSDTQNLISQKGAPASKPDVVTGKSGGNSAENIPGTGKSSSTSREVFSLRGPKGEDFFTLNKVPNSQSVLRAALQNDKVFLSLSPDQKTTFIENLNENLFNSSARFEVKAALMDAFNIKDRRMQINFLRGKIKLDELIADRQNFNYEKFKKLFTLKVGGKHPNDHFLQVALEKVRPGSGNIGTAIPPTAPSPKIIRAGGSKTIDA